MTGSKWDGMPMLGFDLETSGIDVTQDRIVTAALVRITEGHRPHITRWLVNPGVEIPEQATAVHGITTDYAREHGGDPAQMLFEVTGQLAVALGHGIPVVGFNVSFDLTLLEVENQRHGIDTLVDRLGAGNVAPVIDVHVLDKYADQFRKGGRKLADVCRTYGITHTGEHDAVGDVIATCRIWPRLMAKHSKKFPGMTLPALHQAQVGWRRDQMDGLRAYFDKKGTPHDGCDGSWPLQNVRMAS